MGTDAHVLVTGPDGAGLLDLAQRRIDELEQRWSRFLEESEVSRLNALAGSRARTGVAPETLQLLERAALARQVTEGTWNPLLGGHMAALGYDRTFSEVRRCNERGATPDGCTTVGLVDIDPGTRTARLPHGVALDLGGIAKGFAADLVTGELMAAGAWGAMVNLGGDLRVRGLPPEGLDWVVEIGEPAAGVAHLATVRLPEGAIATSTTARRRWQGPGGERHHLLDPATGEPADTPVVVTSVIAGEAWWAEVAATALTVRPELALPELATLQLFADGSMRRTADFESYER
jgi:thiamine biosynthesis lipoprotein